MACDFRLAAGQTQPQRKKQIDEAMERLKKSLSLGIATIKVGPTGAIAFAGAGAEDFRRTGISDTCAYRKLMASGSPELRRALARAEAAAGRRVDERQIAAGVHSHDSGNSWDPGHK